MADQSNGLSGGKEGLDQLDGIGVFGQVPHRAVAARIEDGVVVLLFHTVEAHRLVELALRSCVLFEATGDVGLEIRILTLPERTSGRLQTLTDRSWRPRYILSKNGSREALLP